AFLAARGLEIGSISAVGEDPGDAEAREASHVLRQRRESLPGADPAPPQPGIHLEQHVERDAGVLRRSGQRPRPVGAVHADPEPDLPRERDEPGELRAADHLIGQEDVPDARARHHLGLADLGEGEADRPGAHLPARDLHALVRLAVRPELHSGLPGERRPAGDVALEAVHVDDQRRRIDRVDAARHLAGAFGVASGHRQAPRRSRASRSAPAIRSGVSGMSRWWTPRRLKASTTALTTAGVDPIVAASPMPLAPSGFRGVGVTEIPRSIGGSMWAFGMPYSDIVRVSNWPCSSYTTDSRSAWLAPWAIPPWTCPSTSSGLITRPQSSTATYRTMRTMPVWGSISTTQRA